MMDLESLTNFLSSAAHITGLNYQIWNKEGKMVFSAGGETPEQLSERELQGFFETVIKGDVFRYTVCKGGDFLCGIPLGDHQGFSGALLAFGQNIHEFSRSDAEHDPVGSYAREMENFVSSLVALVQENFIVRKEMEDITLQLDQSFEDLNLYATISSKIRDLKFSTEMLEQLITELIQTMQTDAAFTFLPEISDYWFHVIQPCASDKFRSPQKFFKCLINLIPPDSPLLEKDYFIVNDSRENLQYKNLSQDVYRCLFVRIRYRDNFYGWIGLVSFNMDEIFRQGELKLLVSMAEQMAIVIANTDLYNDLEQFTINMVKSMVFAIEAKDTYTRGHSERVSQYALLVGERLSLSDKEYSDLKWASILHDIGKIGMPESILNKPGPLTDDEYDIVKEHCKKGCEILKPMFPLKDSILGILHHHERYDGRGYPLGLKGEEIPIFARIIAVADTFDAITSSRAYREGKNKKDALRIIEEVSGTQLDPAIVQIFRKIKEQEPKIVTSQEVRASVAHKSPPM